LVVVIVDVLVVKDNGSIVEIEFSDVAVAKVVDLFLKGKVSAKIVLN